MHVALYCCRFLKVELFLTILYYVGWFNLQQRIYKIIIFMASLSCEDHIFLKGFHGVGKDSPVFIFVTIHFPDNPNGDLKEVGEFFNP